MADNSIIVVFGGTGTIGRQVVRRLKARGAHVRAMTRRVGAAHRLFDRYPGDGVVDVVEGDLTVPPDVAAALDGATGVVMTHGAPYGFEDGYKAVDYGAVANVINALNGSPEGRNVKVALMSSIGTSHSDQPVLAWKFRGEEALRDSGLDYVIVRPGWFADGNEGGVRLRQGDRVEYGQANTDDIAEALVEGLFSDDATGTTFEVFTEVGAPGIAEQFAGLERD